MKKFTINIDLVLLNMALLLAIMFFATAPLRNIALRHLIVFVGSVIIYIIAIRQIIVSKLSHIDFFVLFLVLSLLLIKGALSYNRLTFSYIYNDLNFYSLLLLFSTQPRIVLSDKEKTVIHIYALIMTAFVILTALGSSAYVFEDGRSNGALALGMTNSNLAAMMMFCIFSLLVIRFRRDKKQFYCVLPIAILFYLLLLTDARSCIVSAIIVVAYTLLLYKFKIPKIVIAFCVILGALVVPFYLYLFHSGFDNFTFLGKQFFSGREITYRQFLVQLSSPIRWLFGVPDIHFTNAHNAALSIISSIGLIGFASTYGCFLKRLFVLDKENIDAEQKIAIVSLCCIFIQTSAEALMLVGYFVSTLFIYIFLLVANDNKVVSAKTLGGG